MKTSRAVGVGAFLLLGAMITAGIVASRAGYFVNPTASAPRGIWHSKPLIRSPLRGDLVVVCPPDVSIVNSVKTLGILEEGDCPGVHTVQLLKPVAAVAGDVVEVRAGELLIVNGRELPNSRAKRNLPAWAAGTYRVPLGEIWLVSSFTKDSFDSRYFGPVSTANLRGLAKPVFVFGDVEAMTKGEVDHGGD
jgi:conjugative transfer signal peptidase TraF